MGSWNCSGSSARHVSSCSSVVKMVHHSIWALPFTCRFLPAAMPEETPTKVTRRVSASARPAACSLFGGIMTSRVRFIAFAPKETVGRGVRHPSHSLAARRSRARRICRRRRLHVRHLGRIGRGVQWMRGVDTRAFGRTNAPFVRSSRRGRRPKGVRCLNALRRAVQAISPANRAEPEQPVYAGGAAEFGYTDVFVRMKLAEGCQRDGFFSQVTVRRLRLNHCVQLFIPGVEMRWARTGTPSSVV